MISRNELQSKVDGFLKELAGPTGTATAVVTVAKGGTQIQVSTKIEPPKADPAPAAKVISKVTADK